MDLQQTIVDTTKVAVINTAGIVVASMEMDNMRDDLEWGLKISSLVIAISYTVWKWYKDYKNG